MAKAGPGFELVTCGRCSGKGFVRGFEHIHDGVCYDCRGAGKVKVSTATIAANRKPRASVIREIKSGLDRMKEDADEYGNPFELTDNLILMGIALAHADRDVYDRAIAAIRRLPASKQSIEHSLKYMERIRVEEENIIKSGRRRTYGRRDPERKRRKIPAGSLKRRNRKGRRR